jgi:hypothetical protein
MFTKAISLMFAMTTTIIPPFDIKPAEFGQMIDIERVTQNATKCDLKP